MPDITVINPYAAYNLTYDRWDVRPPAPEGTAFYYQGNPQWEPYASEDLRVGRLLKGGIEHRLSNLSYDRPRWTNAMITVSSMVDAAVALMTDIHGHRRDAFKPGGRGYWDFNNWRWQVNKRNGVVKVLAAIEAAHTVAKEASEKNIYGGALTSADDLITRAALWNS